MYSVANMTLSSLKQVLAEVKRGCPIWFGLLHPYLLLDTKKMLAVLGERDSTKVPGTDPSCWQLISELKVNLDSGLSDAFELPGTPANRA